MNGVVRYTFLLLLSVVVFLGVLSVILWHWSEVSEQHSEYRDQFLSPAQARLSRAQRDLARIQFDLLQATRASTGLDGPALFRLISNLTDLERPLVENVRLANIFGNPDHFGLPRRAHEQFAVARESLLTSFSESPQITAQLAAQLDPVQYTLAQLEDVYNIDERKWYASQREASARSIRYIVFAIAALALTGVPVIVYLALGLRTSIALERRAHQSLQEAKQNLEVLAMYDSLTDLGNRNLFKARLDQVVESSKRSQRLSALLYIDLDNFKRINDSLGHDLGDSVLKVVATRLEACVRSTDTVARLGGDEFTVILVDVVSSGSVASLATKLLRTIEKPISLSNNELVVSASVGITMMPADGQDPTLLMKNADMALYKAKEHGRNRFEFFVEAMHHKMVGKMAMESELRAAIKNESFTLHYQPQLDLATGHVTHMEALLRWPQPDGTIIAPDEFVPLADEAGLLNEIGGWVLMQACRDLTRLRQNGAPDLRISVNLSAGQFRDQYLVQRIEDALGASALEPSALELEITETTLIGDIDAAVKTLDALRILGTSIAIDDFGMGYSSLSYLRHLPIDVLKIDKSFVRDIEKDESDRSIVDAILSLARSLSMRVVAEGVENKWQLRYLTSKGCDVGQGFLFSKPRPVDELSVSKFSESWAAAQLPNHRLGLHLV